MGEQFMLDIRVYVEYLNAASIPRTRLQTHAQEDADCPGGPKHQQQKVTAVRRKPHERIAVMGQTLPSPPHTEL